MSATLPPLPEPTCMTCGVGYSEEVLRAYGAECARAEREACALLCAAEGTYHARAIAAAIRARSET